MNPYDQNNQQQPATDYRFITNQPTPKKSFLKSKKFIALLVAVVILVALAAVSLYPKDYSTQAGQVSMSYYKHIGEKQYDAAYALLDTNNDDQKAAFDRLAPVLQRAYNMSACVDKGTKRTNDKYHTTVNCPSSTDKLDQTFVVQAVRKNKTMKITEFVVEQEKTAQ